MTADWEGEEWLWGQYRKSSTLLSPSSWGGTFPSGMLRGPRAVEGKTGHRVVVGSEHVSLVDQGDSI